MKKTEAKSLGAVYIYIYIYISRFLPKRRLQIHQNIKYVVFKAYKKISLILYVQNKIGYAQRISERIKRIKLLHNSLSFL